MHGLSNSTQSSTTFRRDLNTVGRTSSDTNGRDVRPTHSTGSPTKNEMNKLQNLANYCGIGQINIPTQPSNDPTEEVLRRIVYDCLLAHLKSNEESYVKNKLLRQKMNIPEKKPEPEPKPLPDWIQCQFNINVTKPAPEDAKRVKFREMLCTAHIKRWICPEQQ
jgi:hypothetical protein